MIPKYGVVMIDNDGETLMSLGILRDRDPGLPPVVMTLSTWPPHNMTPTIRPLSPALIGGDRYVIQEETL